MASHERMAWAEQQRKTLLVAGISAVVVEETVERVLRLLPAEDVNLAEWVQAPDALQITVDDNSTHEARIAWYASRGVAAKYKRILDAIQN